MTPQISKPRRTTEEDAMGMQVDSGEIQIQDAIPVQVHRNVGIA